MDKIFDATLSPTFNIYDKCYKSNTTMKSEVNYVNTNCEDNIGLMTFFNDPNVKKNWNIPVDKDWAPCNDQIYVEYRNGNNSYWIYPYLIQNKIRVVMISLFSGFIQEMLTLMFPSLVPRDGLMIYVILWRCR